jgi:hypothetical protein
MQTSKVLSVLRESLAGVLVGEPCVQSRLKQSKFEHRVEQALRFVAGAEILREIMLPIRVTFEMRKYLDAAGVFQQMDWIGLRVDMAFWDEGRKRVVLVEVDGSQHGSRGTRFFNRTPEDTDRSYRRDAVKHAVLKHAVLNAGGTLIVLRIPPHFERADEAVTKAAVQALLGVAHPDPCPPPQCILLNLVPELGQTAVREMREMRDDPVPTSPLPQPVLQRSISEPCHDSPRVQDPSLNPKIRTEFNRRCKLRIKADPRIAATEKAELLEAIKERQRASDMRKRPRDDARFPYDLKWWKAVRQWSSGQGGH